MNIKMVVTMVLVVMNVAALALDGKALYTKYVCQTCHGADGNKTIAKTYPKIGGQNAEYAIMQMIAIRDGKRTGGQTALMKPLVAKVTDDEFKAIAKWLETIK